MDARTGKTPRSNRLSIRLPLRRSGLADREWDVNAPLLTEPVSRSRPAPEWLRDLVAARVYYEERLGWPVTVEVAERRLAVALGRVVDAVTMPAGLAVQVHAGLGIALQGGPVIAHTEGGRWTFLTQPASPGLLVDELVHGVRHIGAGAYTMLPVSQADQGWRWITEPRPNQTLPSPYAVVAMVRRVRATV
jgi:hypothetical protein